MGVPLALEPANVALGVWTTITVEVLPEAEPEGKATDLLSGAEAEEEDADADTAEDAVGEDAAAVEELFAEVVDAAAEADEAPSEEEDRDLKQH